MKHFNVGDLVSCRERETTRVKWFGLIASKYYDIFDVLWSDGVWGEISESFSHDIFLETREE